MWKRRFCSSFAETARDEAPADESRNEGDAKKEESEKDALVLLTNDEVGRSSKAVTHVPLVQSSLGTGTENLNFR